ncbi:hypothetical protein G5B30_09875 [Sphingobacterium sp. SGG-5]|uniref:hypothetical protein n=1 Tax=Sphingobacterium sp. SGG-5 TaxID=2710881 RepID=UPI0013E9E323|nr:hypothetical protein [Sphingobacterium sp. SGG-5]NGM62222.1 hypothetical protein [Sphingobacterium sp. SGG-5]
MNKLFTTAALACALTLGLTSCDKDKNGEEIATLLDSKATIQSKTMIPDEESTIFFNIDTNNEAEETASQISLSGTMNLDLKLTEPTKYRLGYFDSEIKNIEGIKVAVLDTASINYTDKLTMNMISGPMPSIPNGWYNYLFTNHTVAPIEGRYVILFEGNEDTDFSNTLDKVYIIQLTAITQNGGTADDFSIKTKIFTK